MSFWELKKLDIKYRVFGASIALHFAFILALFIKSFFSASPPIRVNKNILSSMAKIHFLGNIARNTKPGASEVSSCSKSGPVKAASPAVKKSQTQSKKRVAAKAQVEKKTARKVVEKKVNKQQPKKVEKVVEKKIEPVKAVPQVPEKKAIKATQAVSQKKEKEPVKKQEEVVAIAVEAPKKEIAIEPEKLALIEKLNIPLENKVINDLNFENVIIDIRDLEALGSLCEWERDMQIQMAGSLQVPSGFEDHEDLYIKIYIDKQGKPEIVEQSGCKVLVIVAAVEQVVLKTSYPQQLWGKYKEFLF